MLDSQEVVGRWSSFVRQSFVRHTFVSHTFVRALFVVGRQPTTNDQRRSSETERAFAQAERFVNELESRKLRAAYVFVGDEAFFRKRFRDAILEHLVPPDLRDFGFFEFDLSENDLAEVLDRARTPDMEAFDWQIIIAEGMSDDGTRQILQQYSERNSRIIVIDNPRRIVSAGLNAAIAASVGEIILRMDAHTEYGPDYVKKCVEVLEATQADNVGGPARTKADGVRARAIQAAYHSRFSTGGARFHDDNYTGYVDTVTYGCWRKSTLLKLGLFDEQLVRNQDDELNLRITRSGGKIWQSSEIRLLVSASHGALRAFPPIFPVWVLESCGHP